MCPSDDSIIRATLYFLLERRCHISPRLVHPTKMAEHKEKHEIYGQASSQSPPPWAWIKCVRDRTNPLQNPQLTSESAVDLPVEILPWMYLSDKRSAMNVNKLADRKITHILSVHAAAPREIAYFQDRLEETGIIQKRVSCDDTEGYPMVPLHWEACCEFLRSVQETPMARVVVHCVAGINRSGLVACAACMVLGKMTLLEALDLCLSKRGAVLWNRSFQRQLCELALQHNLLGDEPEGYTDEPLIETLPPPPPAHDVTIGKEEAKFRLASHLSSKLARRADEGLH